MKQESSSLSPSDRLCRKMISQGSYTVQGEHKRTNALSGQVSNYFEAQSASRNFDSDAIYLRIPQNFVICCMPLYHPS